MNKEQSIIVYEDTKTKTTRYKVNGVDITSSIELLKEQFLNQWNNEHKLTTELSFYERNKYAKQISDLEAKLAESEKKHVLDETEWQNYCAFKHIEPQIKGCLDRERKYEKQLAEKEKEIEVLNKFLGDKATEIEELEQRISDKITSAYGAELIARSEQFFLEKQIQELKEKNQHKIDFTITELERVREFAIKNKFVVSDYHNLDLAELNYGICFETLCKQINNQIAEITHQHEDKGE